MTASWMSALLLVPLLLAGCAGGQRSDQAASSSATPNPVISAASSPLPAALPGDIAFVRSGHIWRARADGGNQVQVSSGPGSDYSPVWSPDHTQLAFVHVAEAGLGPSTLRVVTASGDELHSWRFANPLLDLCFSPDGRRIATAELRAANGAPTQRIAVIDTATGQREVVRNVRDHFATGMTVSWSPDGRRLLLAVSRQDGEGQRAGLLALASGRLVWLRTPDADGAHWSRTGNAIVVSQGTQAYTQVALAATDGAVTKVLARGGGYLSGRPTVMDACFSPSGTRIAYCKGRAIWAVGVDGRNPQRIVANGGAPAWAPR